MKQNCQQCDDRATFHITEIDNGGWVEVDLCYKCAHRYLQEEEPHTPSAPPTDVQMAVEAAEELASTAQCPFCHLSFDEFRTTGRLGCPHDYDAFHDELRPLMQNIHGAEQHVGKVPRHLPADTRIQTEMIQLRQELQQAVAVEDYERAAQLRDKIDTLQKQAK